VGERRGELSVREEEGVRREEWDIVVCWKKKKKKKLSVIISNLQFCRRASGVLMRNLFQGNYYKTTNFILGISWGLFRYNLSKNERNWNTCFIFTHTKNSITWLINMWLSLISVAQLIAIRDNLCRGQGSNNGFPTSSYIMCVNLATRLLDNKKKKYICC